MEKSRFGDTESALLGTISELVGMLEDASIQIEYLHEKFGVTGSGNAVLARIDSLLAKVKGPR